MRAIHVNLVMAWIWILLGFLSGSVLGLFFARENWLGGYASFKRRLYRLAHISFFGLGLANLAFYFTAQHWASAASGTRGRLVALCGGGNHHADLLRDHGPFSQGTAVVWGAGSEPGGRGRPGA